MKHKPKVQDRRNSVRVRMSYPVVYNRFDDTGRTCDQKPCKSMDVGSGGVRLKTSFPVDSGEMLDISLALGHQPVTFRGKVVYAMPSEDQGFELGISIQEIENEDRIALTRFVIQEWQRKGV